MKRHLVICSKSAWLPAIRREHALAELAAEHGYAVIFLERPLDVRALRDGSARSWWAALFGRSRPTQPLPGVEVIPRATAIPGHRGSAAQALESALLRRTLTRLDPVDAVVVATTPWQWPAVRAAPAARRVFDCADDWSRMIEPRRAEFSAMYRQIAREADTVVAASNALAELFPGAKLGVVRNGVSRKLLDPPLMPPPEPPRLVYTGTLSRRFDSDLCARVLSALPSWRMDIYGQCQYPSLGDAPAPELEALLNAAGGRAAWHGPISRDRLAQVLDQATVLIVPFRPGAGDTGGDAMKLYDYAARGRPIVTTRWSEDLVGFGPPGLYQADTPEEFAAAVREAAVEPTELRNERRRWARQQTWQDRWQMWEPTLFGEAR